MDVFPLKAFTDNYIWTSVRGARALVVDPGVAAPVLDFLAKENLSLSSILITHHHADHVGGVEEILRKYPCPVYGPADIPLVDHPLVHDDLCDFPDLALSLQILAVPGHTLDHLAYYGQGRLFCGDTLFGCGCGRLFEGTAEQMWQSLRRLARLPSGTLIYCGHEYTEHNLRFALTVDADNVQLRNRQEMVKALRLANRPSLPSRLDAEMSTNPFLRANDPVIMASVSDHFNKRPKSEVESFALLRQWRDTFL